MPQAPPQPSMATRILPWALAVLLLLLAYPAYLGWRRSQAPMPAPRTQMTLTPAEQAEFESQLYALMPRLMMKDANVEKVYKEGKDFVMEVKSGDVRMILRMQKNPQPDTAPTPAPKPAP